MTASTFHWSCKHTWRRSANNTAWCLLGCAIGDFGTILFFQLTQIPFPVLGIMTLAIINGLITSIILETIILMRQGFVFNNALKTAVFKALLNTKPCLIKIIVSNIILVINPFIIARVIIPNTGNGICVS